MGEQVPDVAASDGLERYRQRRRRPREARGPDETPLSDAVDRAFDLVPEIGEGLRWYDLPYRVLMWGSSGWRRRLLPARLRQAANTAINYLLPYNQHDRDFAWPLNSRQHNVFVPEDDHVKTAGIWVVELFPPSELPAFEDAIMRNGWKRSRKWVPSEDDNSTRLQRSRTGQGGSWWRVATAVKNDSRHFVPDGIGMDLPPEFDLIEVRAIEVGAGLTAALAHFRLTDDAESALDVEWHRHHEPILLPRTRGRRRHALDRRFAAYHQTQTVRKELHDVARGWMREHLSGFFANNRSAQLLVDLLLFDDFDPMRDPYDEIEREEENKHSDAIRALGLSDHEFRHIVSPSLPKLALAPRGSGDMCPALGDEPIWTLWGSRPAIIEAWGEDAFRRYAGTDQAIAHHMEGMYSLMVLLAVSEFVTVNERRYADLRDRASTRHGKFKPQALKDLRKSFLTLSLDLSTVRRDTAAFWSNERVWRSDQVREFRFQPTPWIKHQDEKRGNPSEEQSSFHDRIREVQTERFEWLAEADRDYREILSTVASLGASIDASKIGRWALGVALVSLVVAVTTIVLADVGCNSLVHQFFGWPSAEVCQRD